MLAADAEDNVILESKSRIVFLCRLPCLHLCTPSMTATTQAAPKKKKMIEDWAWIPIVEFQFTNPKFA